MVALGRGLAHLGQPREPHPLSHPGGGRQAGSRRGPAWGLGCLQGSREESVFLAVSEGKPCLDKERPRGKEGDREGV